MAYQDPTYQNPSSAIRKRRVLPDGRDPQDAALSSVGSGPMGGDAPDVTVAPPTPAPLARGPMAGDAPPPQTVAAPPPVSGPVNPVIPSPGPATATAPPAALPNEDLTPGYASAYGVPLGTSPSPTARAQAKLDVLTASTPSSKVSVTPWGVEAAPPVKPSKTHEALMGILQGAIAGAKGGPVQGTALRALGGAATGGAVGAINPNLMQALERSQEETRTQADLERAQSNEAKTAQIRDIAAQAKQREAQSEYVMYTPPGGGYPVPVDRKTYASLTSRDAHHADMMDYRDRVMTQNSANANARQAQWQQQNEINNRRIDSMERHNLELERQGRVKEARTGQTNLIKWKAARTQADQYAQARDKADADAERLEQQANQLAADAENQFISNPLADPAVARKKIDDIRSQAKQKREEATRAHNSWISAQSRVDSLTGEPGIPSGGGTSQAKPGDTFSKSQFQQNNNASPDDVNRAVRKAQKLGLRVVD